MDIPKILKQIRPGAEYALNGDTYAGLNWLDKIQTKPTLAEIEAAWPSVSDKAAKDRINAEIKKQIAELDLMRIRPIAEGDTVYLAKLTDKIKSLRAKLV